MDEEHVVPEIRFTNPFNYDGMPDEPPRGAVIAYQLTFPMGSGRAVRAGMIYDYVSFRARDGKWYTTGKRAAISGETWDDLFPRIQRSLAGPVKYVTEWSDLHEAAYRVLTHAYHATAGRSDVILPDVGETWEEAEKRQELDDEDDEPI